MNQRTSILTLSMLALLSCDGTGMQGQNGQNGQQGAEGSQGQQGPAGPAGMNGMNGKDAPGSSDKVGTRLKRYSSVLTADDGTQVSTPSYLYRDTRLNMDCYFQSASDGKQRCLPNFSGADVLIISATTPYFADSGCNRPLYMAGKPCLTLKYLVLQSITTATCAGSSVQYAVYAAPSSVIPTALFTGAPAACSPVSKANLDGFLMSYLFFDLGGVSPINPTQFVSATTTQVL